MHAFIISGGTKKERTEWVEQKLHTWDVSDVDRITLQPDENSIGIAMVRDLGRRVSLAPSGNVAVAIIHDADKITREAQHAFLKTLEEPPPRARFILELPNADALIPTIISRSQVTVLAPVLADTDHDALTELFKILRLKKGARLRETEAFAKTKTEALDYTQRLLSSLHSRIAGVQNDGKNDMPMTRLAAIARAVLLTQKYLRANVSPRLCLDIFFLSLPEENHA